MPWVLERHPDLACPRLDEDALCLWPGRLGLAQVLWSNIDAEPSPLPITDQERRLLDESLESYSKDPEAGTPWPEAKAELPKQL